MMLKICKFFALLLIAIGFFLALGTASTSDYEIETKVPLEEQMTIEEITERLVYAGIFTVAGACQYVALCSLGDEIAKKERKNDR